MTQSLVSPALRQRVRGLATPVALAFGRMGLTPDALTVIGFIGTCVAAWVAATGSWTIAGILVIVFGVFDLFDGTLARATGRASKFGAFLDSTLDRTGESLVLAGVAYACAIAYYPLGVGLAVLALALVPIVTYTRAKAEALRLHGEVGFAPRPERLVVLSAGLLIGGLTGGVTGSGLLSLPPPESGGNVAITVALSILVITSAITIVQRILHVRRQLDSQQQENQ